MRESLTQIQKKLIGQVVNALKLLFQKSRRLTKMEKIPKLALPIEVIMNQTD